MNIFGVFWNIGPWPVASEGQCQGKGDKDFADTEADNGHQKGVLSAVVLDWDSCKLKLATEHKTAEATRAFWDAAQPKLVDAMCKPTRRVLRDSKTHPVSWTGGGGVTSHKGRCWIT